MRQIAAALAMLACLFGCGGVPPGEPVRLLTEAGPVATGVRSCFTNFALGQLVVDAEFGTAIVDETAMAPAPVTTPVMWRAGFTARRAGSEVVVYDDTGKEVARTGRRYQIAGGYVSDVAPTTENDDSSSAFFACDYVNPR